MHENRQDEALHSFARALDANPSNAEAHAFAASILERISDTALKDGPQGARDSVASATAGTGYTSALLRGALQQVRENIFFLL
jgi:type II secretory pathway component PulK